MVENIGTVLDAGAMFWAGITLKSTVFMGAVLLAVWLMSPRQAAKRNLLLSLCVVGVLVIPVASVLLPGLQMPSVQHSFYQEYSAQPESVRSFVLEENEEQFVPAPLVQIPVEKQMDISSGAYRSIDESVVSFRPVFTPLPQVSAPTEDESDVFAVEWFAWTAWTILGIYLMGVLFGLVRLGQGLWQVRKLRHLCTLCDDARLVDHLDHLRQEMGIKRSVKLAVSDQIGSPTQFGLLKPVVVLPASLDGSHETVLAILIHELVHVKRWDCFYRLLSTVAGVLYWFNPVFHRVNRLLSEAQEQVCDDWTVDMMGNSRGYAQALLNVATQMQPRPVLVMAMDMARSAQVLGRVDRIITLSGRVSPRVGRLSALIVAGFLIGGATAIGSMTTANNSQIVDHIEFAGGVAVADTSAVNEWNLPYQMRDGRFWWYGDEGFFLQDKNEWQIFALPKGGVLTVISAALQARDGSMWFYGIYEGLASVLHFDGKNWEVWQQEDGVVWLSGGGPKMIEDRDEGIWIGAEGIRRKMEGKGVLHYDGEVWKNYREADGLLDSRVYSISKDVQGDVSVATFRGVSHYKDGQWVSDIREGVSGEGVRNVYRNMKIYKTFYDRDGVLWVLHDAKEGMTIARQKIAISRFDGQSWTHFDGQMGLPMSAVKHIRQTRDGALWFGAGGGKGRDLGDQSGLLRYKDGMWLRLTQKHGNPVYHVESIVEGDDSDLYVREASSGILHKLPLDDLVEISGRVIDERSGQPSVMMGVWAEYEDREIHAGTVTDINGQYRLKVTSGSYRIRPASQNAAMPVAVAAKTGDSVDGVDLVLLKSRRIVGRVVDVNQQPIANAVVVISGGGAKDARFSPQVVETNENGVFEGWQVVGRQALLEIAAEGYVQNTMDLEQAVGGNLVIQLEKGTTLHGRLVDDAGQPLAGMRISAGRSLVADERYKSSRNSPFPKHMYTDLTGLFAETRSGVGPFQVPGTTIGALPYLPFQRNACTDKRGIFSLKDVNPDGAYLWLNHPDVGGLVGRKVVPKEGVVDVPVERLRLYSISGVALRNNKPMRGVTVKAMSYGLSLGNAIRPKEDRADTNGVYSLGGLEPGTYVVMLQAYKQVELEGKKKVRMQLLQSHKVVIEDRDIKINFSPLGDRRIVGRAMHNGRPLSGVYVQARILSDDAETPADRNAPPFPEDQMVGLSFDDYFKRFFRINAGSTDDTGKFELWDLPAARIIISLSKSQNFESGSRRWTLVDTIDLRKKKTVNYFAKLNVRESKYLLTGQMAPDFEAKRLDGSTFRLSDYRGKKAVLLDFWATWCKPCVDEIALIKKIAETYDDLEVVGVSLDREREILEAFVKEKGLNYVQVFDREKTSEIYNAYGVKGIPAVFLIDKNGVLYEQNARGRSIEGMVQMYMLSAQNAESGG